MCSSIDLVVDLVYSGAVREVGVHEAKTNLSRLLREVVGGEEIVITRGAEPVARLVPIAQPRHRLGLLGGILEVPDDFDAPLSEVLLAEFER